DLVAVGGHPVVRNKKVVDRVLRPVGAERDSIWYAAQPRRLGLAALFQQLGVEDLPSSADQRVARVELHAKPGHETAFMDRVQPQSNLGQLRGDGIEVDAEYVIVRKVHLYALLLVRLFVRRECIVQRPLLATQVGIRKLLTASFRKAALPIAGSQTVS